MGIVDYGPALLPGPLWARMVGKKWAAVKPDQKRVVIPHFGHFTVIPKVLCPGG